MRNNNIWISKGDMQVLVDLGKTYFICKGERPMSPHQVVHELIEKLSDEAYPMEHTTPGFDRQ